MHSYQSVFQTVQNRDECMQIVLFSCASMFNVHRYINNSTALYFKMCHTLRFLEFEFSLNSGTQKRTIKLILSLFFFFFFTEIA